MKILERNKLTIRWKPQRGFYETWMLRNMSCDGRYYLEVLRYSPPRIVVGGKGKFDAKTVDSIRSMCENIFHERDRESVGCEKGIGLGGLIRQSIEPPFCRDVMYTFEEGRNKMCDVHFLELCEYVEDNVLSPQELLRTNTGTG